MVLLFRWCRILSLAVSVFATPCLADSGGNEAVDNKAADGSFTLEAEYGREWYSSPLVRFNDQGPLMQIVGRNQLAGNYVHLGAFGVRSFVVSENLSFQLSGSLLERRFADASDLDLGMKSIDGLVRYKLGSNSFGLGPSLQRISSGGRHFRERQAVQFDWTHVVEDSGYTSIVAETGNNRHSEAFRDFDSLASLLLIRQQFLKPIRGIDELSFEVGGIREANLQGQDDLSSRQTYVRLSSEFAALGVTWTLSAMVQRARFDASFFDGQPSRRDIFVSGDLSASYPLGQALSLRLSLSRYDNRANVALFDSSFKGNFLSLVYSQ